MDRMEMTHRRIVDGNLIRTRNVEPFTWTGDRIVENWHTTDPAGHVHTVDGFSKSTYQPFTEASWCEVCGDSHGEMDGVRRCRQCDAPIVPDVVYGRHTRLVDHGDTWSVEHYGVNVRSRWENLPDDPVFVEMIATGEIGAFIDRLVDLFGEAPECEISG